MTEQGTRATQLSCMSQGLPGSNKNTLATFKMKGNTVLTKLGECSVALIDDTTVYSQTWKDDVEHVKQGLG